ncbi:MAG: penicillin-binding transpeptidase domain-containing protein, partial [Acidimicrobiia bacterium]
TSEVERSKADAGMAAMVDVKTGNVVMMVNIDGRKGSVPAHPATTDERNRVLTDVYEPGSTTKVITAAGALESGAITVDTPFSVPSSITIGGKVFPDDEAHGRNTWTVREILAKSSNVGAIEIAAKIGRGKLDRTMREFGFGARTAIQFPYESAGLLHGPDTIDPSIMGSMPIGYGISTTAMQTLGVFSTVAAGGVSHPARLVDATIDADGNRHRYGTPKPHRVISSQTAATLNDLLRGVVSEGTGVKAAVPGYTVAGKTGTSRKAPYTIPYKYMASFAGFAPAEAPRFAAVVVLDNPRANGQVHGGAVAAPVFSKVMQYALHLFHVQPTASIGADAGRSGQVDGSGGGTVSTPVP